MTARVLELVECPDPGCTLPAEVVDRFTVDSTAGPLERLATVCPARHQFCGVGA